jgi:hypothetical protein
MPRAKTFAVTFTNTDGKGMERFSKLMAQYQDALALEMQKLAEKLGVSEQTASAIQYLRTRSRWTQKKENELIRRDKKGNPVDFAKILSGEF